MLNSEVFKNISQAHKRILVVTKYFDTQKTQKIIQECYKNYAQLIF
jgi:inorganic pyrophosphatase